MAANYSARERVPVAEEAERVSLVAAMGDTDALELVLSLPEDAYTGKTRTIRASIGRVASSGADVDLVSVGEDMRARGDIGPNSAFESIADFTALANDTPIDYSSHVETYVDIIRKAYVERVAWRSAMRANTAIAQSDVSGVLRAFTMGAAEIERAKGSSGASADDGLWRPQAQYLHDLMAMELPATRWILDGIFAEGLTLFGAKAKRGKTTFMMFVGLSIAQGALALGGVATERADVLYLALEDNPRRIQRRMRRMLQGDKPPRGFAISYEWPALDQGGIEALRTYAQEYPDLGLVVIDTLEHIRPQRRNGGGYADDYASVRELQRLASELRIAIVVLHHLTKRGASDPFDEINSTMGLLASVDNMLVMRDGPDGVVELHRRGREYDDTEPLALKGDEATLSWRITGKLADVARSPERNEILEMIRQQPGMGPRAIANALGGKNESTVKNLLSKMLAERVPLIQSRDGKYFPAE